MKHSVKTFYLFRHALATKGMFGYGSKIRTAEILAEGMPPIRNMAVYLKEIPTDFHVCSEFLRCRQTAAIVSKVIGKQFIFDKRLNEFYQESFSAFKKRVENFLADIEKNPHQVIVVCSHAAVITVMVRLLAQKSVGPINLLTNYPKSGVLVIVENGKVQEIDFNRFATSFSKKSGI